MAALVAPTRQEIVDVLAEMGTVAVAELAASLGRPANALYFHLRALTRAGLVKRAGYRLRGGRREALFCTIAPELWLGYEPEHAANREAVVAIVNSMLRLSGRDFQRAIEYADVKVSGPSREIWALRKTGRLSLAEIAQVNRSIKRVDRDMSKPHGTGRLYGITILLTPLDHRPRKRTNDHNS